MFFGKDKVDQDTPFFEDTVKNFSVFENRVEGVQKSAFDLLFNSQQNDDDDKEDQDTSFFEETENNFSIFEKAAGKKHQNTFDLFNSEEKEQSIIDKLESKENQFFDDKYEEFQYVKTEDSKIQKKGDMKNLVKQPDNSRNVIKKADHIQSKVTAFQTNDFQPQGNSYQNRPKNAAVMKNELVKYQVKSKSFKNRITGDNSHPQEEIVKTVDKNSTQFTFVDKEVSKKQKRQNELENQVKNVRVDNQKMMVSSAFPNYESEHFTQNNVRKTLNPQKKLFDSSSSNFTLNLKNSRIQQNNKPSRFQFGTSIGRKSQVQDYETIKKEQIEKKKNPLAQQKEKILIKTKDKEEPQIQKKSIFGKTDLRRSFVDKSQESCQSQIKENKVSKISNLFQKSIVQSTSKFSTPQVKKDVQESKKIEESKYNPEKDTVGPTKFEKKKEQPMQIQHQKQINKNVEKEKQSFGLLAKLNRGIEKKKINKFEIKSIAENKQINVKQIPQSQQKLLFDKPKTQVSQSKRSTNNSDKMIGTEIKQASSLAIRQNTITPKNQKKESLIFDLQTNKPKSNIQDEKKFQKYFEQVSELFKQSYQVKQQSIKNLTNYQQSFVELTHLKGKVNSMVGRYSK